MLSEHTNVNNSNSKQQDKHHIKLHKSNYRNTKLLGSPSLKIIKNILRIREIIAQPRQFFY